MQDSLGGKAATVMIACVAPEVGELEESMNTMTYASRARRLVTNSKQVFVCMRAPMGWGGCSGH
jgi:hypothetical protein